MVADQGIKNINVYDVFANIVPGLIFLFGLSIPFKILPLYRALVSAEVTPDLGIAHLLLLITISFACGQMLQVAGSRFDGDHGFNNLMWRIRGEERLCRYDLTDFENKFWDLCRYRYQLTGKFESHGRLFNALLSDLEHSGRNRALRMQALYLFARGFYIALLTLSGVYYIIMIALLYGFLPDGWGDVIRSPELILVAAVIVSVLSWVADANRKELEQDWIEYLITECYQEFINRS